MAWIAVGGGLSAALVTLVAILLWRGKDGPSERAVVIAESTSNAVRSVKEAVAVEAPSNPTLPLSVSPKISQSPVLTSKNTKAEEPSTYSPVLDAPPKVQSAASIPTAPAKTLPADELFAVASPAVVLIEVLDRNRTVVSSGSGFFVSHDGLVATNHHVVENGRFFDVKMPDDRSFRAEGVVARDVGADLAILKVRGNRFPSLSLASGGLPPVGKKVYAIGTPLGVFTNTLSDGLVGAHRKVGAGNPWGYDPELSLIQITAAISHGSSGGPLLVDDGTVVGVTTLGFTPLGANNVNMAVPVEYLRRLLHSISPDHSTP